MKLNLPAVLSVVKCKIKRSLKIRKESGKIGRCDNVKAEGDSSVGIALGYGLDGRGSRVRFPAGAGNSSLHHRVQNDCGAHPASYPMVTRGSFPGGKAAGS
jgi:hypothetical protein